MGENVRTIRQLRGMKQETLAKKLGIAQQNVSKMEKKSKIPDEVINKAAQAMDVSAEFIKKFDKGAFINNVVAFIEKDQVNNNSSVQEVISYFKEELSKKDSKISELEQQISLFEKSKGDEKESTNLSSESTSRLSAIK